MKEESNYPKSSFIRLFDNKKSFYYEIIKEETYPFTKQLYYIRNLKYPILHDYIVKIQHAKKHIVEYSIEYIKVKLLFKIRFEVNFIQEIYSSETSIDAACKYYQVCSFKNFFIVR